MKTNSTRRNSTAAILLSMSLGLMMAQASYSAALPLKKFSILPGEEEPVKKSKAKNKAFSSRNNSSVKIFPDAIKRIMHVVAKENEGKEIDFFVFDLQGTLLHNYKMKAKDHMKIEGLARGTYIYRVFCGDQETATGNFEIR